MTNHQGNHLHHLQGLQGIGQWSTFLIPTDSLESWGWAWGMNKWCNGDRRLNPAQRIRVTKDYDCSLWTRTLWSSRGIDTSKTVLHEALHWWLFIVGAKNAPRWAVRIELVTADTCTWQFNELYETPWPAAMISLFHFAAVEPWLLYSANYST